MGSLLLTMAYCLGLTILLETGFALFVGIRGRKNLLTVILTQVITNPCAVLGMLWCGTHLSCHYALYELPIEALVVLVEWLIYRKYLNSLNRPFAYALASNYFSYSFGIVIGYFGVFPRF